MREKFWKKLQDEQRTFKWFYDNYIRDKVHVEVKYNTLYQQAKGEMLTTMDIGLKHGIINFLND